MKGVEEICFFDHLIKEANFFLSVVFCLASTVRCLALVYRFQLQTVIVPNWGFGFIIINPR